jgi:hypothetical protein
MRGLDGSPGITAAGSAVDFHAANVFVGACLLVADEFVGGPVGHLAGGVAVGDRLAAAAVLEGVRAGGDGFAVIAISGRCVGHVVVVVSRWLM